MKPIPAALAMLALTACAATTADTSAGTAAPLAEPARDGALDLFPLLDAEAGAEGNIIYSPASVSQAFGLLQLGAGGDTLAQLQAVLPSPADAASLESDEKDVEVSLANALWLSQDYRFRGSYVAAAKDRYDAVAERIDVTRPRETAERINAWADKETRGLIPSVVQPEAITPDLAAMLTNALYFEGKWETYFTGGYKLPFLFGDGHEEPFHLMEQTMERATVDKGNWRALRLPYRNPRYAMDVIMPAEREVMGRSPSLARIAALGRALGAQERQATRVRLPRFEIDWGAGLVPALKQIGLTLPFDRARADLSAMAQPGQMPLAVSAVKQFAKLQVFDEGTKAAAVTAISIVVTSAPAYWPEPIEFTVDRPFVIVLRDLERETILFIGRIAAPEPYDMPDGKD